jgi:hypothetical protein
MFDRDERISSELKEAWRHAQRRYAGRDNVLGVGIGLRMRGGKHHESLAVRIHIREKIDRKALSARELLPRQLRRKPVDVVDGLHVNQGPCPSFRVRVGVANSIQPGFSAGNQGGEAGTIGALVRGGDGKVYLLSAFHVLYLEDSRTGDPVTQPARPDGGGPNDIVARLAAFNRQLDAAVALVESQRSLRPAAFEVPRSFASARLPVIGEVLSKSGRSTCVTRGRVDYIGPFETVPNAMRIVALPDDPNARICDFGDSGAVWFDETTGEAVGLHLKGDPNTGSSAVASLLASSDSHVGALDALGVTVI